MQSPGSLSLEQKSVLESTYHTLEGMVVYIRAVMPCVTGTDEQLLSGLVELAELCLNRLPQSFPELTPIEQARKERGGL